MDYWIHVFSYLSIKDINSVLQVSKSFNKVCNSPLLWRILIKRDFGKQLYTIHDYKKIFLTKKFWQIYKKDCKIISYNLYLIFSNISLIPEKWDPQINTLNLYNNKIKIIPYNWYPLVSTLDLSNNKIEEIPEKWAINIRTLNLQNNNITEISEKWNPRVKNLFLSNNKITKISKYWNPDIERLWLLSSYNIEISDDWNPPIRKIFLYSNQLKKIPKGPIEKKLYLI